MSRRALVAFSGGGAKGVVHVGALKALEERGVQLCGVAGTSAGAIVACLAAAGLRSSDMIDVETNRTILDKLNRIDPRLRRATDLFGRSGWLRVRLFRVALHWLRPWYAAIILWLTPAMLWGIVSATDSANPALWWWILWTTCVVTAWLSYRSFISGLADVRRFRDALGELLRQRLFPDEPGRVVVMRDFGQDGRPSLKIVSANLSRRTLHLFSAERTPDIAVADAVAASICLPIIFRPWKINGDIHVDGGIVSNLPAWPFDEERELDPEALTIAVEIADRTALKPVNQYNWLPAAIRTGLFGSGQLNLRIAGPAEQLAMPTDFDLLDFDRPAASAAEQVQDVATAVGLRLDRRLFRLPEIYQDACQVAQAVAADGLGVSPTGTGDQPRIRVGVGRLERGYTRSLRLTYSVGFEDDADEGILLPLDGSVAGRAWRECASQLERYPLPADLDLPGEANRLRRKTRWKAAQWVMCIPVLNPIDQTPLLLIQLEGSNLLTDTDEISPETTAALLAVEETIKTFFSLVLNELNELEINNGL